jgi:hypothetical protein
MTKYILTLLSLVVSAPELTTGTFNWTPSFTIGSGDSNTLTLNNTGEDSLYGVVQLISSYQMKIAVLGDYQAIATSLNADSELSKTYAFEEATWNIDSLQQYEGFLINEYAPNLDNSKQSILAELIAHKKPILLALLNLSAMSVTDQTNLLTTLDIDSIQSTGDFTFGSFPYKYATNYSHTDAVNTYNSHSAFFGVPADIVLDDQNKAVISRIDSIDITLMGERIDGWWTGSPALVTTIIQNTFLPVTFKPSFYATAKDSATQIKLVFPSHLKTSGSYADTILLKSNDPSNPVQKIPLTWVLDNDINPPIFSNITPLSLLDSDSLLFNVSIEDVSGINPLSAIVEWKIKDSLYIDTLSNIENLYFSDSYSAISDTLSYRFLAEDLSSNQNKDSSDWTVIYPIDDDSLPPTIDSTLWLPKSQENAFLLAFEISDESGVFDETLGSQGQGAYVLWDSDGELASSSKEVWLQKSNAIWVMESSIPNAQLNSSFVFQVHVFDNDKDNPSDKKKLISDVNKASAANIRSIVGLNAEVHCLDVFLKPINITSAKLFLEDSLVAEISNEMEVQFQNLEEKKYLVWLNSAGKHPQTLELDLSQGISLVDSSIFYSIGNFDKDSLDQLSTKDLSLFLAAWKKDSLAYDIAPFTKSNDEILISGDSAINFEDLALLAQLWYQKGVETNQVAKTARTIPANAILFASSQANSNNGLSLFSYSCQEACVYLWHKTEYGAIDESNITHFWNSNGEKFKLISSEKLPNPVKSKWINSLGQNQDGSPTHYPQWIFP